MAVCVCVRSRVCVRVGGRCVGGCVIFSYFYEWVCNPSGLVCVTVGNDY